MKTPVLVPLTDSTGTPASSRALYVHSISNFCCGSMRSASILLIPNRWLSNELNLKYTDQNKICHMYIRCIYFQTHSTHYLQFHENTSINWCLGHSSHLWNSEENVYKPKMFYALPQDMSFYQWFCISELRAHSNPFFLWLLHYYQLDSSDYAVQTVQNETSSAIIWPLPVSYTQNVFYLVFS